jgi:cell division protease FtsH
VKMDPSVDLMGIARATPGASGADLANVLNEAALLAARRGRSAITSNDVSEACDKVRYGKERRSLELDEKEKRTTAYHETGHALVGLVVEHSDPVEKVTIVPRGMSLGATHFLPEKNKLSYWRKQVIDQLAVLMGGRAAEEICVGDVSSGAQQDIRQATALARSMVCEWGMSDQLGLVAYDERNDSGQYLGLSSYKDKNYSEVTAERIDIEVKKLLDEAYAEARRILQERRHQVETMTQALMEFESLDAEDVKLIVADQWNADEKRLRVETADQKFKKVPPPVPPLKEGPGDFVPA